MCVLCVPCLYPVCAGDKHLQNPATPLGTNWLRWWMDLCLCRAYNCGCCLGSPTLPGGGAGLAQAPAAASTRWADWAQLSWAGAGTREREFCEKSCVPGPVLPIKVLETASCCILCVYYYTITILLYYCITRTTTWQGVCHNNTFPKIHLYALCRFCIFQTICCTLLVVGLVMWPIFWFDFWIKKMRHAIFDHKHHPRSWRSVTWHAPLLPFWMVTSK